MLVLEVVIINPFEFELSECSWLFALDNPVQKEKQTMEQIEDLKQMEMDVLNHMSWYSWSTYLWS